MELKTELEKPDLTCEKLCLLVRSALRKERPDVEVECVPPNMVKVVPKDREAVTLYVDNLWFECRGQSAVTRLDIFQRYLCAFLTLFDEPGKEPVCRDRIVSTIKDSEYFAVVGDTSKLIREHLVGDLWIVYAIDLSQSIKSLSPPERDRLGIHPDELRTLAIENLRNILPQIEQHGSGPWYLLTAGGDYVASLILFDTLWDQLGPSIDGDIVAVVPARDVVLFTGSLSKEGIEQIRARAREIVASGGHVISDTLIRRTSGQWKVFD